MRESARSARLRRLLLIATLLVAMLAPFDARGQSCYPIPASIDSTGTRDVTAELQAFIVSIPDGSCISFPSPSPIGPARYRAEGSIRLTDRVGLTIHANGAILFATTHGPAWPNPGRVQLVIEGGSDLLVHGLTINSIHATCQYDRTYEFEHGVGVYGAARVTLRNLFITNVPGDFVYIDARPVGGVLVPPRDVSVDNAPSAGEGAGRFECNGRQGVAAAGGSGLTFRNLYLRSVGLTAFDLENLPGQDIRDVVISGNRVEAFQDYFVAAASAYGGTHGVTVTGNQLLGKPMSIIVGGWSVHSDWAVTGNTSDSPAGDELVILRGNVSNFAFRDNVQPFAPTAAGRVLYLDSLNCTGCMTVNPCHVFAGGNVLAGARVLFYPADGQEPCDWVDEGGNMF